VVDCLAQVAMSGTNAIDGMSLPHNVCGPSSTSSMNACIGGGPTMLCDSSMVAEQNTQLDMDLSLPPARAAWQRMNSYLMAVIQPGGGSPVQAPHALLPGDPAQCVEGAAIHRAVSPSPTQVHVLLTNKRFSYSGQMMQVSYRDGCSTLQFVYRQRG